MPLWEWSPWEDRNHVWPSFEGPNNKPKYHSTKVYPGKLRSSLYVQNMGKGFLAGAWVFPTWPQGEVFMYHRCWLEHMESSIRLAPPQCPFPMLHVGNGWTLRWGLSDSLHTLLLGQYVKSPQAQHWWRRKQLISLLCLVWRSTFLHHIPKASYGRNHRE